MSLLSKHELFALGNSVSSLLRKFAQLVTSLLTLAHTDTKINFGRLFKIRFKMHSPHFASGCLYDMQVCRPLTITPICGCCATWRHKPVSTQLSRRTLYSVVLRIFFTNRPRPYSSEHYNASVHKVKCMKTWFAKAELEELECLAQSPAQHHWNIWDELKPWRHPRHFKI